LGEPVQRKPKKKKGSSNGHRIENVGLEQGKRKKKD